MKLANHLYFDCDKTQSSKRTNSFAELDDVYIYDVKSAMACFRYALPLFNGCLFQCSGNFSLYNNLFHTLFSARSLSTFGNLVKCLLFTYVRSTKTDNNLLNVCPVQK